MRRCPSEYNTHRCFSKMCSYPLEIGNLATLALNEIMFQMGEAGNKSDDCEVLLAVFFFFSFLLQAERTFVPIVRVLVLFTRER